MFTLVQSSNIRGSAGDPLPKVWEQLDTDLLRGQLVLVAAGPGTGKSAFVLNYALKSKVSCLYFSADSDAFTQLTRSISIVGGYDLGSSAGIVSNNQELPEELAHIPIRFSYESSPTLSHIEDQMLAYEELYGEFPELVVVDNALDVQTGDTEDQFQSLDALMAWLHDMARQTGACVIVLHHVTGAFNDASSPIPLSGVKGQIGRVPEVILTLHKEGMDVINVSTVKNRGGRADPSGQTFTKLLFIGDRMSIEDYVEPVLPEYDPTLREEMEMNVWG